MIESTSITPKTEHRPGHDRRVIPLFPELRPILEEAYELARHSDVTMTMRYTHIGLQDQAKAIENLPTDPKWLETGLPTEPMSQHICSTSQQICSKSGVSAGHSQSTEDTGCHSETAESGDTNPCDVSPSVTRRQKKAPPVTDGALVEAAGIEPGTR